MKRFLTVTLLSLTFIVTFQSCNLNTQPPDSSDVGDVRLSIQIQNVGSLSKTSTINLENLFIEFSNGSETILDTVTLNGHVQIIVNNTYTDLASGVWNVLAETRDVNSVVIHADSTNFTVIPNGSANVNLSLSANYSMLIANFIGIADSVSRCEVLVDAVVVADSSFLPQSQVGSTVSLSYDYMHAGMQHTIRLDAYGVMWNTEYLLYTGDTTVTVEAGVDNSYAITLVWVGPDEIPAGTAEVEIVIGPSATLTVNGNFPSAVTDIDGNVYQTIQIGNQVWMAENLRVTHYRDGTVIPNLPADGDWSGTGSGAYCFYANNSSNGAGYGALYNWYAVNDSRNIAPAGWHVPTDDEWQELEMALGMSQSEADGTGWRGTNEGSKLADNAALWADGALENNSEFGTSSFTALPGGYRIYNNGSYNNMGNHAYFWSVTEFDNIYTWFRELSSSSSDIYRFSNYKRHGFSVRLLRD